MDPKDLYKQTLLKHSREPLNKGPLEGATHQSKLNNALCGDEIEVYLKISDGKIETANFIGQCCSICTASASMLTHRIRGTEVSKSIDFSKQLIAELKVKDKELSLSEDDELHSLSGVKEFASRIRCATLPWEALLAAQPCKDEA